MFGVIHYAIHYTIPHKIHYTKFRKCRHIYANNNNYYVLIFSTRVKFIMEKIILVINYTKISLNFISSFFPPNIGDSRFYKNIFEMMKFLKKMVL
jgi:hypothetical protein